MKLADLRNKEYVGVSLFREPPNMASFGFPFGVPLKHSKKETNSKKGDRELQLDRFLPLAVWMV